MDHPRDPRAQKHREAEKRHREKLADNLAFLRTVIPNVTDKEQKADIYAKAAAYILYLKSLVPSDKWNPSGAVLSSFMTASALEGMSEDVRTSPSVMPPAYSMPYMPQARMPSVAMGQPSHNGGQMPANMPMMPMAHPMMGHMMPPYPMFFPEGTPYGPFVDPMRMYDMHSMMASNGMPHMHPSEPPAKEESRGTSRKRKGADRSGASSDTGSALSVDGSASGSAAERDTPLNPYKDELHVVSGSSRRRRRVENVPSAPANMLDTLASLAASKDEEEAEGTSSESTARDAASPSQHMAKLTLAKAGGMPFSVIHNGPTRQRASLTGSATPSSQTGISTSLSKEAASSESVASQHAAPAVPVKEFDVTAKTARPLARMVPIGKTGEEVDEVRASEQVTTPTPFY